MAKGKMAGYHCKVCYEQAMKERARKEAERRHQESIKPKPVRPPVEPPAPPRPAPVVMPKGCVFAKSCTLPDGVLNHSNPGGFVPVEPLKNYGTFAVLGTGAPIAAGGTPLLWIGGSGTATALASRLGGTLALGAVKAVAGIVAAPAIVGTAALIMPNTTSPDSAFYTSEQYALLGAGNTRVRVNVKHLPDGSISAYGFYTGNKTDWQSVPVIAATPRGEQLVADLGSGVEVIWTPAVDPNEVLGIPALEGAPQLPAVWVYPPTEQAEQILINPEHPPAYQDAIIWFPSQPTIAPIYLSLSVRYAPGVVTGIGEDVPGIWLDHARAGLGAPIPTSVADQLRGRRFSSFDAFRKAFWIEVGNDPELSRQFNQDNVERIQSGNAPAARDKDTVGKRSSFELHHVERVTDGGAVYDVDNLRVNTPRNHIDIHRDSP